MSRITVYKCDHNGAVVWQYPAIIASSGPTWVCLTASFDRDEADLGFVVFRRGDVFTEWFYTDRWYNIFRIKDGITGQLKGWYCNITRPAVITADSVRADDLALDVFVMPNGNLILLDELEFDTLDLPAAERINALRAVETIRHAVSTRTPPFTDIRPDTGTLGLG
jgi:protein associated with RNAse G/E